MTRKRASRGEKRKGRMIGDERPFKRLHLALAAGISIVSHLVAPAAAAQEGILRASEVTQPEGWDAELRIPEPEDLNPDPHILEFNLEARIAELEILPETRTPAWTYNGQLPGPLIRAEVGDRLIVHFTNSLPEATTIHWHGVRVPNDMDGAPGLTQEPIPPGGGFRYEFTFEDAGTFWYHPHLNSPAQVARGLYGAIVVTDPDDPVGMSEDELVVVLSDIALEEDGSFRSPDRGGSFGVLFGREGDIVLVNGKVEPRLQARAGKSQRWRVVNAAITRYVPISLREHRWVRVGGDGGLAARAEELPRLVLAPGERADLVFEPVNEPGTEQLMSWLPVDRGFGTAVGRSRVPMMTIATVDAPAVAPDPVPVELRAIPPIDVSGATEREIALTIDLEKPDEEMMGINGVAHHFMMEAALGETQVWNVVNDTDFDHPFHLHGFFFQVLDETRIPEWKDTVNVPAKTSLRLAVSFDERPGMWMIHCHILDHAEAGMMGHLQVSETGAAESHRAH
jgi:FtsP/CotA-like multicopper oxidase with cupredoxin domain